MVIKGLVLGYYYSSFWVVCSQANNFDISVHNLFYFNGYVQRQKI